ncbi:MAG: phosphomannose isomerase type II C-terminal cupin domain [Desulfatiglandales bacterium]
MKIIEQVKREDQRPWGFYEILSDSADHKVKRITVYPGRRPSYQRHFRRSEHWFVIKGKAVVARDDEDIQLMAGRAVDLPVETWHRVQNPGGEDLVFIEVRVKNRGRSLLVDLTEKPLSSFRPREILTRKYGGQRPNRVNS